MLSFILSTVCGLIFIIGTKAENELAKLLLFIFGYAVMNLYAYVWGLNHFIK